MWEVHPVLCENVTVRNLHIATHGPNNDGCDPESCRDVLIDNCFFDTGDDCIAIKSGRNNDGRRLNTPSDVAMPRRVLGTAFCIASSSVSIVMPMPMPMTPRSA